MNRDEEGDGTKLRGKAENVEENDSQGDGSRRGKVNSGEWVVQSPTGRKSVLVGNTEEENLDGENRKPKGEVVEARGSKVDSGVGVRNDVVTEGGDDSRHDEKENHTDSMGSYGTVESVLVTVSKQERSRYRKLDSDQNRKEAIEGGKVDVACGRPKNRGSEEIRICWDGGKDEIERKAPAEF